MHDSKYLLDANVLIAAKKDYYSFDIVPGFWDFVNLCFQEGVMGSIDHIYREISQVDDDLLQWVDKHIKEGFISAGQNDVVEQYSLMVGWVMGEEQFYDHAKAVFAQVADGWLVAYAKARNFTVVTHEVYRPDIKNRVPIPNVCRQFDVPYKNTFEMLRELKPRFGLLK